MFVEYLWRVKAVTVTSISDTHADEDMRREREGVVRNKDRQRRGFESNFYVTLSSPESDTLTSTHCHGQFTCRSMHLADAIFPKRLT